MCAETFIGLPFYNFPAHPFGAALEFRDYASANDQNSVQGCIYYEQFGPDLVSLLVLVNLEQLWDGYGLGNWLNDCLDDFDHESSLKIRRLGSLARAETLRS